MALRRGKYNARRTWSELCGRWFASAAEAHRGDQLMYLQRARRISALAFQPRFMLGAGKTYTADFAYDDHEGRRIVEDIKGVLTRDTATRLAWLRDKHGVVVEVLRAIYRHKRIVGWDTIRTRGGGLRDGTSRGKTKSGAVAAARHSA